MKISLNWLKDFVEIPKNLQPKALGELFTMKTAEVEEVKEQGEGLDGVFVGELIEIKKHPSADKLNLAKVDVGGEKPLDLIFGDMVAMREGEKIPVAVAPTTLPTGVKIEKRMMRGYASCGMLCLDQELGFASEGVTIQYFPDLKPGTPIVSAMGLDDVIFDIDNKSLTHRPDLWGHYGIAREFSALLGKPLKNIEPLLKFEAEEPDENLNIVIKNAEISPLFAGCTVSGVEIKESPAWMKKRLLAVEIRPVNNVVDITNYVMMELGQPMHAYDRKIVGTDKLEIRFAEKGEFLETIDHKKRALYETDPVVTNGKAIMGMAGIMGGANSEINEGTTEVIFEAANWNPSIIRRSSTRHGLRSEASQRFEKGLDPGISESAVRRALVLLSETCPNMKLETKVTIAGGFKPHTPKIALDPETCGKKIGIKIETEKIIKILKSLGFKTSKKGEKLEVAVPPHRATGDIKNEDDLIEEVARLYGYDEIPKELPALPISLPEENKERVIKHKLRNILSLGLGFTEVLNYSFYGHADFAKCGLVESAHFELENYLSEDQKKLRTSLAPNLLKSIAGNLRFFDYFKIYEIGRTYKNTGEYFPKEEKWITGAIVYKKSNEEIYKDVKGALETLLKRYGAPELKVKKDCSLCPYAHPVKFGSYVSKDSTEIARVFELHPGVAKNFELEDAKIGMFEINFTELVKLGQAGKKYTKIPRFPGIDIDVSVLIDRGAEAAKIEKIIRESDTALITNIELFDVYEGENIEKDKKAMAFRITLQALDRTLTEEDMTKIQNKIFQNLQGFGGKIRGLNN